MPLISVPAVYEGGQIRLLEPAPVQDRYRVLVTFVEPDPKQEGKQEPKTLSDLKGSWRHVNLSYDEIQAAEYRLREDIS